ncbi:hypothetical protein Q3G72_035088 [Acer saccharum]|nr:hypothetical protein Q3G72_035088 [Acer saccharum]
MPFGLKNAGATYQRLVNKMFAKMLRSTMEVYIDDMLVKSLVAQQHIDHLRQSFDVLDQYGIVIGKNRHKGHVITIRSHVSRSQEKSTRRGRNPPRLDRGSREHREENDSDRRYDQDRMARDRDRPRRRTHRRDRPLSLGESEQNYHRKRQRGTVLLHGLNRKHKESNPEEMGQKLTISQNFNAMGEPERDKDILILSLTREVQNNRRQMDALVRRYGRNELSADESGSPFTMEF